MQGGLSIDAGGDTLRRNAPFREPEAAARLENNREKCSKLNRLFGPLGCSLVLGSRWWCALGVIAVDVHWNE